MKEEDVFNKGTKGSATAKVRKLQKQYNKILVDLFDQFAAESIEEALEDSEGSFGENIQGIVQCALDTLKGKVMQELGVSNGGEVQIAIGSIGPGATDFLAGMKEEGDEDGEDDESKEHEDSESDEFEAGEQAAGDDDEEDEEKDEEIEEKTSSTVSRYMQSVKQSVKKMDRRDMKTNNESVDHNKIISKSHSNDQTALTEAYTRMYTK